MWKMLVLDGSLEHVQPSFTTSSTASPRPPRGVVSNPKERRLPGRRDIPYVSYFLLPGRVGAVYRHTDAAVVVVAFPSGNVRRRNIWSTSVHTLLHAYNNHFI